MSKNNSDFAYKEPASKKSSEVFEKNKLKLRELESKIKLYSPQLLFQVISSIFCILHSTPPKSLLYVFQFTDEAESVFSFYFSSFYQMTTLLEGIRSCHSISKLAPTQLDITEVVGQSPELGWPYKPRPVNIIGDLNIKLRRVVGLTKPSRVSLYIEVDRFGHFYKAFSSRVLEPSPEPSWDNDETFIELECSTRLNFFLYEHTEEEEKILLETKVLELTQDLLKSTECKKRIGLGSEIKLSFCHRFSEDGPTKRIRQVLTIKLN